MSWLLHPLTPFILDGLGGLVAGVVWRTRGIGAAGATVVIGAGMVALGTLAAHLWAAWRKAWVELHAGEPDEATTSRIPEETLRGIPSLRTLLVLMTDFVFNLVASIVVAGLTYLALRIGA